MLNVVAIHKSVILFGDFLHPVFVFQILLHALFGHYEQAPRSRSPERGEEWSKDTKESGQIILRLLSNRFLWFFNVLGG